MQKPTVLKMFLVHKGNESVNISLNQGSHILYSAAPNSIVVRLINN